MVSHTQNLCSAFYPSKVHTHSSEHTHRDHTRGAVGSHLCCGARRAVGGLVPCSRTPRRGIIGRERALDIHSPHQQSLPDRDSNSQPFDYEFDCLTITPLLPLKGRLNIFLSWVCWMENNVRNESRMCCLFMLLLCIWDERTICWLALFQSQ